MRDAGAVLCLFVPLTVALLWIVVLLYGWRVVAGWVVGAMRGWGK
jgi:hypothetical protein